MFSSCFYRENLTVLMAYDGEVFHTKAPGEGVFAFQAVLFPELNYPGFVRD